MTYIDEMLKELCPDGVVWKELGEVCEFIRGNGLQKKDFVENGLPVIHYGQIYTRYNFSTTETVAFTSPEVFSKLKKAQPNNLVMATTSENAQDVGKAIVWEGNEEVGISGDAYIVRTSQNARYLNYYFRSTAFQIWKEKKATGTKVMRINAKDIEKLKVPLPPLKIQEEIVKILDKFTDYVTELTAELTLRKKQYSYYRDKLLSFEDDVYQVEWKTLGEVFDIVAGGDVPKDNFSERQTDRYLIPILSNGIEEKSLYGWTDIPKVDKPSLTVSARGTIGWTSYREKPFYPIVRLLVLTPKIELNLRYAYHFMKSIEDKYDVPQSGIPQLTKPMIKDKSIPLPSLNIQSRIVQVLDNFDTVCNDLNIGLPKEIELRQKQYEFFRDKLLTFTAEGVYTDSTVQTRPD